MRNIIILCIIAILLFIGAASYAQSAQQKTIPAASVRIPVPRALADEYAEVCETERQALQAAQQTPQWKDFQAAQQQRLKIEMKIFGEVGCKPSLARIPRDEQGAIIVDKSGRIEAIECLSSKEPKP